MSEILKNTASQSVFVTVIDSSTGAGKESGVSFTYTAAGGSQGALSGTATHKGNGQYEIVPTQAETNVDCFSIGWYGDGVVPNCVTIFTTTKRLRDLQDLAAGAAMTLTEAGILAIWHQLLTAITTAGSIGKLIKDYLDAAITSRAAPGAEMALVAAYNAAKTAAQAGDAMALITGAITTSKIASGALNGKGDWNTVAPDNASAAATLALVQCDKVAILVDGVYWMSYRVAGTATEIMRKQMLDANGDPVASITTPVAALQGAE